MMLSDTTKAELISAFNTFLASFLLVVATTVSTGSIEWTIAFWGAIFSAALRSAIKAAINTFVPVRLGGRKA